MCVCVCVCVCLSCRTISKKRYSPLDVIRNEQFKTHEGIVRTTQQLWNNMGFRFLTRGLGKNLIAVAMPVGMTIFFTDMFVELSIENEKHENNAINQVPTDKLKA